ncbi:MAG: divergent polysaccharide deacetylase family protein [bacterium]
MKKTSSSLLVVLLLLAVGAFVYYKYYYVPRVGRIAAEIKKNVEAFIIPNILVDPLLVTSQKADGIYELTARMPMRYDNKSLKTAIAERFSKVEGATVSFAAVNNDKQQILEVTIQSPYAVISKLRFVKSTKPKIAVIVDDWGYHKTGLPYLAFIDQPFTVAILPGLLFTTAAAEAAFNNKKGIMLHLPMQPEKKMKMEKITVLKNMDRKKIIEIVDSLAGAVPHYTGVNNHEGSLVTADKTAITTVLEVLKERNYFFIDSFTTPKTVAYKMAKSLGMRWGRSDIFIDNKKVSSYNEKQINKLKALARKKGWAIGIGHDDPTTLRTLSIMMPKLEAEGFEFVYVSELLQ